VRYDIQHDDIQPNDTLHKGLICDTQHKWHSVLSAVMPSVIIGECHILFIVMMSVVKLNVVVLSVVAPNDGSHSAEKCFRFKM